MIHCTRELLWMKLGYAINDKGTFADKIRAHSHNSICGSIAEDHELAYGWYGDWTPAEVFNEHRVIVDCPGCLVAEDAAREGRTLT